MAVPATTRPAGSPRVQSPPADFLAGITTAGAGRPNAVVFHGVEGVGKTSFGGAAPKPIFGMARGETGLETLIDAGRLGETPHFPEWLTWTEALGAIRSLVSGEHTYKTLVLDTLNGMERLCHEHVCARDFGGDWTDKGFMGYMRGYEVALADWRELLTLLDNLRNQRKMSILCLVHTRVASFKNPEGPDFDRYVPDMHAKTWGLTHKWADMVLFANFYLDTKKEGSKRIGIGGQERVLYTEKRAAFDAKNRHGLPPELSMGSSGVEAWAAFRDALRTQQTAKNSSSKKSEQATIEGGAK